MKANKAQDDYPIHFRDKIDEYLFREHGILAGCCSSVESLKYAVAREVAEKLNDAFIEKACDWLESVNLDFYQIREGVFSRQFVEDFKKYMED